VGEEIRARRADRGPTNDHDVVAFGTHPCLQRMRATVAWAMHRG
jgi:hypothetical protein